LTPCTNRDWQAYINKQLTAAQYDEYDEHLYTCDACLQLYMEAIEVSVEITMAEVPMKVVNHIMTAIQLEKREPEKRRVQHVRSSLKRKSVPLTRRPLFQYTVAAIITLVLMSAGVFQGLSLRISHIETATSKEQQESFSQKLMERTVSVLDAVQDQSQGGRNP
jgi:anti-sigma factor RsiW